MKRKPVVLSYTSNNYQLVIYSLIFTFSSVFLGFTKNGQFVLSYTLNVEADEHTAYPIYAYRLQWWHFVPYKKLRKVRRTKAICSTSLLITGEMFVETMQLISVSHVSINGVLY